jgi:hypothetical protein
LAHPPGLSLAEPSQVAGVELVQMESGPRTQTISFSWRPELRFYEHQFELLRQLDDRGALRAFRVGDSQVEGRLFSTVDEIAVGRAGMSFELVSPKSDIDQAWDCVALVLDLLEPQIESVMAWSQYVEEVDLPFEEAIARGQERLASVVEVPGASVTDWAVLLDLQLSEPWPSAGQVEYGIVRAHEVPRRLARAVGRVQLEQPRPQPQLRTSPEDFADISLFVDGWVTGEPSEAEQLSLALARQFWEAAQSELGNVVERLKATLVGTDQLTGNQKGGGSA